MGLSEQVYDRTLIYDLDNNGNSWKPTYDDSYNIVYESMISENKRYAQLYKSIEDKIRESVKPIIITEGKSDWKHLKAALNFLKSEQQYSEIKIELFEYSEDVGDDKLYNRLLSYSRMPNRYKIIGIFDCDENYGRNIHQNSGIKDFGNNVYAMSLPIPSFRVYNKRGISIEFLYEDNDLKKLDKNGRRLYISSEFDKNGRLEANKCVGVKNNEKIKNYISKEQEKIKDNDVIDIEGNSLALTKEEYASNILDQIPPFDKMNFDAFKPVFDRLKIILNK